MEVEAVVLRRWGTRLDRPPASRDTLHRASLLLLLPARAQEGEEEEETFGRRGGQARQLRPRVRRPRTRARLRRRRLVRGWGSSTSKRRGDASMVPSSLRRTPSVRLMPCSPSCARGTLEPRRRKWFRRRR